MSRQMIQVKVDPPLWRGVVQLWNWETKHFGPYQHKSSATRAIKKELRRDDEDRGCFYLADPDAPADQPWRTIRAENPRWTPAKYWHEKTIGWERAD